jgi:hypothetical protein
MEIVFRAKQWQVAFHKTRTELDNNDRVRLASGNALASVASLSNPLRPEQLDVIRNGETTSCITFQQK